MNATDFLLKKYPHVVGLMLDEEGSIDTEISLGEILEEYHREKMEELLPDLEANVDVVSDSAKWNEKKRILGIIEELSWVDKSFLTDRIIVTEELIKKIKADY